MRTILKTEAVDEKDFIVDDIGIWEKVPSNNVYLDTMIKCVGSSQYKLLLSREVFIEAFNKYLDKECKELQREIRAASTLATMNIER